MHEYVRQYRRRDQPPGGWLCRRMVALLDCAFLRYGGRVCFRRHYDAAGKSQQAAPASCAPERRAGFDMTRPINDDERQTANRLLENARAAMRTIEHYDQPAVDRLCRAIAWATYNEETAKRLAGMSVDESGLGDKEPRRRAKIMGVLRDALRQKSIGIIEEIPEKGIVKYGKPAGVIASLIPVTSAYVTPATVAIYAVKCKDAVIFSPHPASKKTTAEVVRIMRAALKAAGAPEDILQCAEKPSIPLAQELMSICDLTIATGGPAM